MTTFGGYTRHHEDQVSLAVQIHEFLLHGSAPGKAPKIPRASLQRSTLGHCLTQLSHSDSQKEAKELVIPPETIQHYECSRRKSRSPSQTKASSCEAYNCMSILEGIASNHRQEQWYSTEHSNHRQLLTGNVSEKAVARSLERCAPGDFSDSPVPWQSPVFH